MSTRLLIATFISLLTTAFNATAGAPDGQPFASCPQGMQCILGGGQDASPEEFGVEQLHLTSPANGEVRMSLARALETISKIPVPKPGDGIFDQALWTLYVKEVFNQLKLSAGVGSEPSPQADLATRIAQLNKEVRAGELLVKELKRELSRLKKQNKQRR